MEETKVIYHIDDEDTPYLVKLPVGPDKVTLADFKNVLNRPNYKFFFKSMDDDFGVVKEEIIEDECPLPCFNGRVVSWLVSADGSVLSDSGSQCGTESIPPGVQRGPGVGETRPPSFHGGPPDTPWNGGEATCTESEARGGFDDTESSITSISQVGRRRQDRDRGRMPLHGRAQQLRPQAAGRGFCNETSSVLSSEIDNTSFFETDDNESMASSRFTTSTEHTSVSRQHANRIRKQKRLRHRKPAHMSRASSISSVTDSTLSLNIITVTLNMDTVNFLGISIVGQSNQESSQYQGGDGGIYVGSIMKGGAVALDGRIEPGDMILQVNDINFENMSNDDAVRVLRDVVQKPGPIKLVVAKCWDPNPKDYFSVPRTEPVRPIDPGAWVAHTAAVRGLEIPHPPPSITGFTRELPFGGRAPSVTTLTSSSPSLASTIQEKLPDYSDEPLTKQSGMKAVCAMMQRADSGLEVRDRMWLKITIPQAFIGSDVVNWLFTHIQGFQDRREARKYASQMLKAGFVKHTVNKATFSEQCYYVFGDLSSTMAACNLKDSDGSETDRDTLAPLPQPGWPSNPPYLQIGAHPVNQAQFPPSTLPGPIYNPAPPPSATYMSFNYSDTPPSGPPGVHPMNYAFHNTPAPPQETNRRSPLPSSGSTASQGSVRIQLAASGSGSESEVNPPPLAYTGPQTSYSGPQTTYTGPQTTYTGPQTTYTGPQASYTGPLAPYSYNEQPPPAWSDPPLESPPLPPGGSHQGMFAVPPQTGV